VIGDGFRHILTDGIVADGLIRASCVEKWGANLGEWSPEPGLIHQTPQGRHRPRWLAQNLSLRPSAYKTNR
jgi:hypothetical protein